jgi:hypothetical protein
MGRPFRALHLWVFVTQGFTLGWEMSPLWGWVRCGFYLFCVSPQPCLFCVSL